MNIATSELAMNEQFGLNCVADSRETHLILYSLSEFIMKFI